MFVSVLQTVLCTVCVTAAVCGGRIVCLGASGCSRHHIGWGGRFDGGVIPAIEGGDCCNVFGAIGCSGRLMLDVVGGGGRFDGGVTPVFDRGDCCTLFCGPLD